MTMRQLEIDSVRGASVPFVLPFAKGKRLTIIYGENGNGKTTICDGLELLGKGAITSLDDRGLGKTARYEQTLGRKREQMVVRLTTTDGICCASVTKAGVEIDNSELRPTIAILRRASMLKLLEADPAKRYEAIKGFIDVGRVERAEDALRKALKDVEAESKLAVSQVQGNLDILTGFWHTAGAPGSGALQWASQHANTETESIQRQVAGLQAIRTALTELAPFPAAYDLAVATAQAAGHAAQQAAAAYRAALENVATGTEEIMDILHAAQRYLSPIAEVTACPLCLSGDKTEDLKASVDLRVEALDGLKTTRSVRDKAAKEALAAQKDLESLHSRYDLARDKFAHAHAAPEWKANVSIIRVPVPPTIEGLPAWLASARTASEDWEQKEGELTAVVSLKAGLASYHQNVSAADRLAKEEPCLRQVLGVVESARHAFVGEVLQAISSDVGALYEEVHPGEGLSRIILQLDEARRSSLQIEARFGGQDDLPPMAYFSQSHLDTLGLCIFIALAKRGDSRSTILVLDDVLTSVDEPHVDRVIEMLYRQAQHFQHCIFTTHYGPWRQKYRWGFLKTGDCDFVELGSWTLDGGVKLVGAVPELERLRKLLSGPDPDVQSVCSKAGVVLEAMLNFLTLQYQCPVPRRVGSGYTLGELLPSVSKKLKDALKVEVLAADASEMQVVTQTIALEPILSELDKIRNVRNLSGAHFNELSFELLDSDAIHFAQLVADLASALIDDDHGWPKSDKSGSHWSNSGDTRRLHPLKKPS
jgi:hypothetical protein